MLNKGLIRFTRVFLKYPQNQASERNALLAGCHITCNFLKTATFLHVPVLNLQVVVVKFPTLYKLSEGSLLLLILTYFKAKERT